MTVNLQTQSGSEKVVSNGILTSAADGATVTIDLTTGSQVYKWTNTQTATVNVSGTQFPGQILTLVIVNDSGAGHVVTMGTGLKSTGTLTGTTSQTRSITFISDGTNFWEVARTAAIA